MPSSIGGGGINANTISSIRNSARGGGVPGGGGLFGAGVSINKDDTKKGLDQIFGLITGDSIRVRNQNIAKPFLYAQPIVTDDKGYDEKKKFDQPFGIADSHFSRNQNVYKPIMDTSIMMDERKKPSSLENIRQDSNDLKIPKNARQNMKDMIAKIVGGIAVSNIRVQRPTVPTVGLQQGPPQQQSQQDSQQQLIRQGLLLQGPQIPEQKNKVKNVYNEALEQLQNLQRQEQLIKQRINLLGPLVEDYTNIIIDNYNLIYTIMVIFIVLIMLYFIVTA